MKKISLLFTIVASFLVTGTGCLKDKGFEAQNYGIQVNEVKGVAFSQSAMSPVLGSIDRQTTPTIFQGPYISLEQIGNATSDVTVKVEINSSLISEANHADSTLGLVELPANTYTLSTTSIVIAAGANSSDKIKVLIPNSTLLDATTTYAVGLTISSVDKGYLVAENQKNVVIAFAIKNQFDGVYSYSGTIFRNSATGPDMALSGSFTDLEQRTLETLGANSVSLEPLWVTGAAIAGIDNTYITVDPVTYLVTMASKSNATLKNSPGLVNKYDPATKTFSLAFEWGTSPNTRVTTMTLKYVKAR